MSAGGRRYRILVVEDDATLAVILKSKLSSRYLADCAYNGKVAIEKIEQGRFDILLLDIGLPDCNGLNLLSEIKRRWPAIQVIIMTGESNFTRLSAAQKRGAIRFIVKPFEPKDVLEAVESAIEIVEHWRNAGVQTMRSSRQS